MQTGGPPFRTTAKAGQVRWFRAFSHPLICNSHDAYRRNSEGVRGRIGPAFNASRFRTDP